jgi:UDP-N-acetylglucosamine 2-epimerase (non-hydrolysing)
MGQTKVMVIFGTRPEAIKMAPVIRELRKYQNEMKTCVVVTAQHRSMLDQVLEVFHIEPDYDLGIMLPGQSLTEVTVRALVALEGILQSENPDLVLVQGDTTTAFVGGLAAFYRQTPVGHIEAGLRTREKYYPYPEEINRHFLDVLADLCFAPTLTAREALLAEGTPEKRILITGNTVIDALLTAVAQRRQFTLPVLQQIEFGARRRTLLVTAHRRENLGAPLEDICKALRDLVTERSDLQVVFPVHLNPKVRKVVWPILGGLERTWLVDPLSYLDFVMMMAQADVVVTDSGGVQEEAPALGKPVLVIRTTTERPEAVAAGTARLIGTARQDIVATVSELLDDPTAYARMRRAVNPYGDGQAAKRIVASVRHFMGHATTCPIPFLVDPQPPCPKVVSEKESVASV